MNVELILIYFTAFTGVIALIILFNKPLKEYRLFEFFGSLFPLLLIVLIIRSVLVEPFQIPSSSLEPTLLVGDFVAVNKFSYGIRLPVSHQTVYSLGHPKRGDIVVFRSPENPKLDYIKRVIGLPGDHLSYANKVLMINGKLAKQVSISSKNGYDLKEENLEGVKHFIYLRPSAVSQNFSDKVVPAGSYFVMGDNRDESDDSRVWGFLPDGNLIGKAFLIWFSWDYVAHSVRWERIGRMITRTPHPNPSPLKK